MNRELECVLDKSQTCSCFIVVSRAVPTHTFWSNEHNTVGSRANRKVC